MNSRSIRVGNIVLVKMVRDMAAQDACRGQHFLVHVALCVPNMSISISMWVRPVPESFLRLSQNRKNSPTCAGVNRIAFPVYPERASAACSSVFWQSSCGASGGQRQAGCGAGRGRPVDFYCMLVCGRRLFSLPELKFLW